MLSNRSQLRLRTARRCKQIEQEKSYIREGTTYVPTSRKDSTTVPFGKSATVVLFLFTKSEFASICGRRQQRD